MHLLLKNRAFALRTRSFGMFGATTIVYLTSQNLKLEIRIADTM
jgi:hypothetical protein